MLRFFRSIRQNLLNENKTVASLIVSSFLLIGCATTEPIRVKSGEYTEKEVYSVSERSSGGFESFSSIRNRLIKQAEEFAKQNGKSIKVLDEKRKSDRFQSSGGSRTETRMIMTIIFALVDEVSGEVNKSSK